MHKQSGTEPTCNSALLCMVDESESVLASMNQLDFAHILNKPVRQSSINNCLVDFHGFKSDYAVSPANGVPDKSFDANVLLVEDHPVNQNIVSRMLSLLGCRVSVANNGAIALEEMRKMPFSVVLMDCDMPVMDGFLTTEQFRQDEEQLNRGYRQPIIALTANALQGDRERCLRIGMDDYASKPLSMETLSALLEKWTTSANNADSMTKLFVDTNKEPMPSIGNEVKADTLDINVVEHLLSMDDGDSMEFISELLSNFKTNWKKDRQTLTAALAAESSDEIRKMAHRMKSASATMGATTLASIAAEIEISAKENNLSYCASKVVDLLPAYEATLSAFAAITDKAA